MERHDVDIVALVSGALFTALGLAFLVDRPADLHILRFVWPALLIVLGVAVLARSRRSS